MLWLMWNAKLVANIFHLCVHDDAMRLTRKKKTTQCKDASWKSKILQLCSHKSFDNFTPKLESLILKYPTRMVLWFKVVKKGRRFFFWRAHVFTTHPTRVGILLCHSERMDAVAMPSSSVKVCPHTACKLWCKAYGNHESTISSWIYATRQRSNEIICKQINI